MSTTEIKDLLPHREPFLFVDNIIEASEVEIIATKVFTEEDAWLKGSFKNSDYTFVPGVILLESMAQSGGAGIRQLKLTGGLFGLASIESANFLNGAEFGKEIKYVIKNIRVSEKMVKQSGVGYMEGTPVVEATWLCIKID